MSSLTSTAGNQATTNSWVTWNVGRSILFNPACRIESLSWSMFSSASDMWRTLGHGTTDGGLVVGTIIKLKLGLQPKPLGEARYGFLAG
jgi:hypothetical protein